MIPQFSIVYHCLHTSINMAIPFPLGMFNGNLYFFTDMRINDTTSDVFVEFR